MVPYALTTYIGQNYLPHFFPSGFNLPDSFVLWGIIFDISSFLYLCSHSGSHFLCQCRKLLHYGDLTRHKHNISSTCSVDLAYEISNVYVSDELFVRTLAHSDLLSTNNSNLTVALVMAQYRIRLAQSFCFNPSWMSTTMMAGAC